MCVVGGGCHLLLTFQSLAMLCEITEWSSRTADREGPVRDGLEKVGRL